MSNFWDLMWLIFSAFVFVAYLVVLFQIVVDLFRDTDLGGISKAAWIVGLLLLPVLTALLVPLMSCSARLPVYVVFGLAFFGPRAGTVIWAMYALGIVVAMLAGMVFTRTILKPDVSSAFVLELPPYRQPALKSVLIHMWENTSGFVRKAGT